jgi:von Willebrand factor type A domain
MPHSGPPRRSSLFVAIAVSVSLHALIGLAWLTSREPVATAGGGISTLVDGPDDRETVFVLLDPPAPRAQPTPPPEPVTGQTPPAHLPTAVVSLPAAIAGPGAVTQSGHSLKQDGSLTKSGGPAPLHGRLKAGTSIVYVLDRSSSMATNDLLHAATGALKASLSQLDQNVRFQVVAYNGAASPMGTELQPATAENIQRTGRWLDGLPAEGRSDHVAGFREAVWLHPDAIYLLTDADDLDEREVKAIAALVRPSVFLNVTLFAAGPVRQAADTPLERFVRLRGDNIRFAGGSLP